MDVLEFVRKLTSVKFGGGKFLLGGGMFFKKLASAKFSVFSVGVGIASRSKGLGLGISFNCKEAGVGIVDTCRGAGGGILRVFRGSGCGIFCNYKV